MNFKRLVTGLMFCFFHVLSYFTNKYVLSVLKFTYPTLFQGWQTFIGGLLLLFTGKLGWVNISGIPRSAALSWLPASFLFVGNIYAGSRALSRLPMPFFFTLQNASEVLNCWILKLLQREQMPWMKHLSLCLLLISAINLPLFDPQSDFGGYMWAWIHLFCVGAYRVFQTHFKSTHLSDLEQQYINYLFSVLLLAFAAHPTGDLFGALEFPFLLSPIFYSGCCASALLGFFLLLATVKLKTGLPLQHCGIWIILAKIFSTCLSPLVFNMEVNPLSLCCVVFSHVGDALLVYSERPAQI